MNLSPHCARFFAANFYICIQPAHKNTWRWHTNQWNWQMWLGAQYEITLAPTVSFNLCHSERKPQWVASNANSNRNTQCTNQYVIVSISSHLAMVLVASLFFCFNMLYRISLEKRWSKWRKKKTNVSCTSILPHSLLNVAIPKIGLLSWMFGVRQREKNEVKMELCIGIYLSMVCVC